MSFSAKRIMNGTFGELWLDGEKIAEVYKFQAKKGFNKESVKIPGELMEDTKITSVKGKGSFAFYKVSSLMQKKLGDAIINGQDKRFTIIEKLNDPDALGAERKAYYGVSFDDLTESDWEAAVLGKVECPFTYTSSKYLDLV